MINLTQNTSLKDFTLIIPSTCVGNVSQLTADLLIENLKMTKVGDVFHDSIPPLIGLSAFEHISDKITTAAELYVNDNKKVAVLQIRTPLTAPLMGDFFEKLVEFAKGQNIKKVILLTASYGYEKHKVQGNDFGYKSNKEIEVAGVDKTVVDKILGGGYAMKIFETFTTTTEIDTLVLFKYVSEGDNIPDAVALLLKLNEIVKLVDLEILKEKQGLKMPVSWKYLFGNRPPNEIY